MRVQRTLIQIFVMPRLKKRAGVGTTASCLDRFIRPSRPIRENYLNMHRKEMQINLFITGRQVRSTHRGIKATQAQLLRQNNFDNVDFYEASQNVTITVECPSERLFQAPI